MSGMEPDRENTSLPPITPTTEAVSTPVVHRRRWHRRILGRLVVYPAIAWMAWCTAMYFFQDKLVFPRDLAPTPAPTRTVVPQNVITVTTEEGRSVEGWFMPGRGASATRPAPAVLSFHGNAEIIDFQDRVPALWSRLGVSLLMPEYRGYGRAKHAGQPSQESLVADGVRFYDELIHRPEVDRSRIIIHGYSIGGGIAAQVAARRKPAALILEGTFTSVADFAWSYGVPPFLSRHPFHTDQVLTGLGVPIFIAHGRRDSIVPVSHGRRLHALVAGSTYVELDCGHLNMPGTQSDDGYQERLRQFLVTNGILVDSAAPSTTTAPAK
jgi:fermentation-respiration switch protein FrsA (DUF1100 family)